MKLSLPLLDFRDYQKPLWNYMMPEKAGLRALLVWPRRNGKDLVSLNILIAKAMQRVGLYHYIAPYANQVRSIIWDGSTGDGRKFLDFIPPELVARKLDQQMKIWLPNGSLIHLVGSDNPDAVVGTNPVGQVYTEMSLHKPGIWNYMRPVLAENGGWALFNGCLVKGTPVFTPAGILPIEKGNTGQEVYEKFNHTSRVTAPHINGLAEVMTLTTARGYSITATPNHKIDTPNGWIRMDGLAPGQEILLQPPEIPTPAFDLEAYVEGVIAGDGTISAKPGCYRVTLTLVKEAKKDTILPLVEKYTESMKSQWKNTGRGKAPSFEWKCTDGVHLRFSSSKWVKNLIQKGVKNFPDSVFYGSVEKRASYLAGLFDTDGSARKGTQEIKFSTSNEIVAYRVQQALFSLGIISTKKDHLPRRDDRPGFQSTKISYTVTITGSDCKIFFNIVPCARLKNSYEVARNSPARNLYDTVYSVETESELQETFDICLPEPYRYQAAGFTVHNTPRGMNHFYQMAETAKRSEPWFYQHLTADDTGVPSKEDIDKERLAGMAESLIEQEFYTSWTASSEETLIPLEAIQRAQNTELDLHDFEFAPRIIGVDPAYAEKGDTAVIARRQGRNIWPLDVYRGIDPMVLAAKVGDYLKHWHAHYCFVDAGRGEAVWSRLHQLGYRDRVIPVHFGGKVFSDLYHSKKSEIWGRMKEHICNPLPPHLPDDTELVTELSSPMFEINEKGQMQLESKKSLKRRGFPSPGRGDALALTYSEDLDETPILTEKMKQLGVTEKILHRMQGTDNGTREDEYDPLNYLENYGSTQGSFF